MNKPTIFLTLGIAMAAVGAGVMIWVIRSKPVEPVTSQSHEKAAARPTTTPKAVTLETPQITTESPPPPAAAKPKPRSGKKMVLDPNARVALKGVGTDAEAERYWLSAINNPLLPPEERKDLIEDLNEDGFSDPKRPGVVDLPLIATRIKLIESLIPSALDKVNAAAFQEAHKDLVNMYAKLSAQ